MDDDLIDWISMAEDNLTTAKILLRNDRLRDAVYHCQQVVEKSLKAIQIKKLKRFDKIHDLQELAESVRAPKSVSKTATKLTKYYISARYPISEEMKIEEGDAEIAVSGAEGVLEWAKSTLNLQIN